MTDIGEIVSVVVPHQAEDPECPFCPEEDPPNYVTYPGAENDSKELARIMKDPAKLVSCQPSARPKEGNEGEQSVADARPKPNPIFRDAEYGDYTCQAHHLISGKQALQGHVFERWIVGGKTIVSDTGYSVNNSDNGRWCPAMPSKYSGQWKALGVSDPETQKDAAWRPMLGGAGQFHVGHHNIPDDEDPDQIKHLKYDSYIKKMLKLMDSRMTGWALRCPLCCDDEGDQDVLVQPSVRVNQILDNLSAVLRGKISGAPGTWDIFLSKHALSLHKEHCTHPERRY